ncbi:uncharacterized protein LOC115875730 [Sitophilus oryzae]|uniref:Uncharacterized protein LOC115875730 n=1 Tax=Sitophilus oryzae TaxID=7048 RepID=A0A6J2X8B4_SITOR|nr:uncharacterized protein LOC115875730 [Sitophilus oryzae]
MAALTLSGLIGSNLKNIAIFLVIKTPTDDLLTGADTIEQVGYICQEVSNTLKNGCFELRKWHSNEPAVLKNISDHNISSEVLEFARNEKTKTLGLNWSSRDDVLIYNIDDFSTVKKCTKWAVLSLIARIFDPLGILSPCIVVAKMFMQRLWSERLSWDDLLPSNLADQWNRFREELPNLSMLKIPRQVLGKCIQLHGFSSSIQLHGFSDSSTRAYGACIRTTYPDGKVKVRLLCAKSKVAPVKTLTIPKLELCAALLLARLADKVIQSMNIKFDDCVFWSDSTIVLALIKMAPNLLKCFIANRVVEIQSLTKDREWRYVQSLDNPAYYVSRGLLPKQILDADKWWYGPSWLKLSSSEWPSVEYKVSQLPELKSQKISSLPVNIINEFPFEKFSKLSNLQRIVAYILRFKNNCLCSSIDHKVGPLTVPELQFSLKCLTRAAQRQSFPDEFLKLSKKQVLSPKNKLSNLTPFLDHNGLIRVGGRLKHSDFSVDKKHPLVLHSDHQFTKLLFEYEHCRLLHAGPQLLLGSIRETFWPIRGRNLARATVRKCLRCFRFNPELVKSIMGNLPRDRVTPSSPFHVTGIDYAGPFLIKRGRGCKVEKCYVGLFVCFSTKALHLELISSLATSSFIQALRRFASRRGKPIKIVSDNGTTFVGAYRELGNFLKSNRNNLVNASALGQINWSFIPPYSPHFGGLWEAGVKSVKHHLKRVLGNTQLTFEEFLTILCQIEGILNSRPLCPLTSDPNDFLPLTPTHFLIGRPLVAVPDDNVEDIKTNRLTRFQLIQQLSQQFWRRWERDFISEMQQKHKWEELSSSIPEQTALAVLLQYKQEVVSSSEVSPEFVLFQCPIESVSSFKAEGMFRPHTLNTFFLTTTSP